MLFKAYSVKNWINRIVRNIIMFLIYFISLFFSVDTNSLTYNTITVNYVANNLLRNSLVFKSPITFVIMLYQRPQFASSNLKENVLSNWQALCQKLTAVASSLETAASCVLRRPSCELEKQLCENHTQFLLLRNQTLCCALK